MRLGPHDDCADHRLYISLSTSINPSRQLSLPPMTTRHFPYPIVVMYICYIASLRELHAWGTGATYMYVCTYLIHASTQQTCKVPGGWQGQRWKWVSSRGLRPRGGQLPCRHSYSYSYSTEDVHVPTCSYGVYMYVCTVVSTRWGATTNRCPAGYLCMHALLDHEN